MTRRRVAAGAALILGVAAAALVAELTAEHLPRGLSVVAGIALALAAAWYGAVRRGALRVLGLGAGLALAIAAVAVAFADQPGLVALALGSAWLSALAARTALQTRVRLPRAPAPRQPVLFYNPRSGEGKATRLNLADEARARGIEPIELTPGADLETLVRIALAAGADGLAMAGGDGSQAAVAGVAAEHGLPYACIPAGTRNHLALDLGVDRDDVVGALDAFVDGGERVVDLAEVNGRVFVNNVSLGVYGEAVQHLGYRHAKFRTLLDAMPAAAGREPGAPDLHWRGPGGRAGAGCTALLVSNNPYRLGPVIGSGTRPRLDRGVLGVAVVGTPDGARDAWWQEWSAPEFEVDSGGPVPAGIDGEAVLLRPPLRFRIRPGALRVRIAPGHPGASPSALQPERPWDLPRLLWSIAAGSSQGGDAGRVGRI